MIDIKIGETYTTPGGVVLKARKEIHECSTCSFNGFAALKSMRERAGVGCIDMVCTGRVFDEITKPEEPPASSGKGDKLTVDFVGFTDYHDPRGYVLPLPTLSGMDEAFRRHVLSVARAEFVALFWDMPSTDLAAAMGVTEKTVRNIRKKRLRKNRESI